MRFEHILNIVWKYMCRKLFVCTSPGASLTYDMATFLVSLLISWNIFDRDNVQIFVNFVFIGCEWIVKFCLATVTQFGRVTETKICFHLFHTRSILHISMGKSKIVRNCGIGRWTLARCGQRLWKKNVPWTIFNCDFANSREFIFIKRKANNNKM